MLYAVVCPLDVRRMQVTAHQDMIKAFLTTGLLTALANAARMVMAATDPDAAEAAAHATAAAPTGAADLASCVAEAAMDDLHPALDAWSALQMLVMLVARW